VLITVGHRTDVSNKSNAPPHPTYWRRILSPGGSFSLSSPISAFTPSTFQGGAHRVHGRHQTFLRNPSSHTPLSHHMAGPLNDRFQSGRSHVPIKHDSDQHLASFENAVRHASEAGLGPVQNNSAAAGSSTIDRQAGYYRGAGYPSAPMGNSAPQGHNRIPQFENATTQSTGHDRTGVGGRDNNIDALAGEMHGGGVPLPAEYPTVQPIWATEIVGLR
jgi:hypothetical protein